MATEAEAATVPRNGGARSSADSRPSGHGAAAQGRPGPTPGALVACFQTLEGIVQQYRQPRDQAERGIRAHPDRPALLKAQGPEAQPLEAKPT